MERTREKETVREGEKNEKGITNCRDATLSMLRSKCFGHDQGSKETQVCVDGPLRM